MKRSVKRSKAGNMITYVGGKRADIINGRGIEEWSDAEDKAVAAFLSGRDDWYDAAWED